MAYAAPSSGTLLSTSSIVATTNITSNTTGNFIRVSPRIRRRWSSKLTGIYASESAPVVSSKPDDLVSFIISKVLETDRGVSLTRDEHKVVAESAEALKEFCVDEPVKCPLIFGEWDVVYCSVPTSPGWGYRSALGRIVFKTKEMIQAVEAPDIVRNKVAFSALGFLDGEVSLNAFGRVLSRIYWLNRELTKVLEGKEKKPVTVKDEEWADLETKAVAIGGKLKALDEKWIQVVFEPPELKVGAFEFKYGGESEVKLEITYIDEKIRLGKGSRGSLFVFQRRQPIS